MDAPSIVFFLVGIHSTVFHDTITEHLNIVLIFKKFLFKDVGSHFCPKNITYQHGSRLLVYCTLLWFIIEPWQYCSLAPTLIHIGYMSLVPLDFICFRRCSTSCFVVLLLYYSVLSPCNLQVILFQPITPFFYFSLSLPL